MLFVFVKRRDVNMKAKTIEEEKRQEILERYKHKSFQNVM